MLLGDEVKYWVSRTPPFSLEELMQILVEYSFDLVTVALLKLAAADGRLEDVADSEESHLSHPFFLDLEHLSSLGTGVTFGVFAPCEFVLEALREPFSTEVVPAPARPRGARASSVRGWVLPVA